MGSVKFLADEDFNHRAIRGVRERLSYIDLVTVQEVGIRSASDRDVLAFAAKSNRILLSHDENTMLSAAIRRIASGQKMPGLFLAPQQTSVGRLVAAVILVAECSDADEWKDRIEYLPI